MYDVITFGCIPVVLSNDLVWAYSDQTGGPLQHSTFSIQIPQSIVHFTTKKTLKQYLDKKIDLGILPASGKLIYDLLEESYLTSGDYDISEQGLGGDGQLIMRVRRFVPDFKNLVGDALITLYFRDYPADSDSTPSTTVPTITGPFTITSSTTKVDTRVRGRQVSLKIENTGLDQNWRYGTLRLDIEAGGRR